MRESGVSCLHAGGFHRMAYTIWGSEGSGPTVLCLHGITRNGRDFDPLAAALAAGARVVCPDLAGRGGSDWLTDKDQYRFSQYLADLACLLARLGDGPVDVVGTSMGGLLAMSLAALPGAPVRRLIINDVGPEIERAGVERIADFIAKPVVFEDLQGVEAYLRFGLMAGGARTPQQWRHLALHGARRLADGRFGLAYDPAVAAGLRAPPFDGADLWPVWEAVRCPALVLRGESSDILAAETAARMVARAPATRVVEFSGIGHAPALAEAAQIGVVADFLGVSL